MPTETEKHMAVELVLVELKSHKWDLLRAKPHRVRMYDTGSYKYLGGIKLKDDCDSNTYDPATKYLYVVNGGRGAHEPYTLISVIDTTAAKKIADIKIETDSVEALAFEKAGPRLFVNITGLNSVGVFDREKRSVLATWSIAQEAQHNGPLAFDEANHRLFIAATAKPEKFVVLDSDTGKVITSMPSVSVADEISYDAKNNRIYLAGDQFVYVFRQQDADHYSLLAKVPGTRATPIDNVIDVHINRLRRKVDEPFSPKLIHTVRGVGFVLREE